MGLSIKDAYDLLELPVGADPDSVRTSYKRLAQKWLPEKHGHTTEALKKFKGVSKAFKRLAGEVNDEASVAAMKLDEMMTQFRSICLNQQMFYDEASNGSESDDSSCSISELLPSTCIWSGIESTEQGLSPVSLLHYHGVYNHLLEKESRKNAQELITEEEKEKKKAEKRRAKKKRQREKKKQEKAGNLNGHADSEKNQTDYKEKKRKEKRGDDSSSSDEAEFDQNSAFFTKVVNKKKKNQSHLPEISGNDRRRRGSDEEADDLNPVIYRSRQLAIKGNEMAQQGHYQAAIALFSEAIKLDPNDYRFFGNRSYCYDRTENYNKALKDAEKAISLSKDWAKGYFRKGRAQAGLRRYLEAEEAFTQVLKLDKNCEDAVTELFRVRTLQITDMGFSRQQAELALKQHGSVATALEYLLANVGLSENSSISNQNHSDVFQSDEDDHRGFVAANVTKTLLQKSQGGKMDPRNPEGLTALWVGNVLPDKVDDKKLFKIFSKFGSVVSVRCLPEKYCAFVNYKSAESAGKAMTQLQGAECGGQKLLIKFPDNPIGNGAGAVTIRKTTQQKQPQQQQQQQQQQQNVTLVGAKASLSQNNSVTSISSAQAKDLLKQSGPVNGNECYFWRTTGCIYGDKCRNKHILENQGLDRKPWQK